MEDSLDDFDMISMALQESDPLNAYRLHRVEEAADFVAALERDPPDVILCDYELPRFSPYAALHVLRDRGSFIPFLVVTRAIGEHGAIHILRCGAKDYVTKDKLGTLPQIVQRVLEERERALEEQRLTAELDSALRRLKELSARLVVAQERERSVISRELHDQLGQNLTAMMMHLHAGARAKADEQAKEHYGIALAMAQEALDQVRTLSFNLRPAQLDLLGLLPAVRAAAERIAKPAGIACDLSVRGSEPPVNGANAPVALRLLQEALTNVVRHSRATRVRLRLRFLPQGRLGLLVLDDGVGFDMHALLDGTPSERNVGLYGMIERTELAGGRLCIRARRGRGVAIRAVL